MQPQEVRAVIDAWTGSSIANLGEIPWIPARSNLRKITRGADGGERTSGIRTCQILGRTRRFRISPRVNLRRKPNILRSTKEMPALLVFDGPSKTTGNASFQRTGKLLSRWSRTGRSGRFETMILSRRHAEELRRFSTDAERNDLAAMMRSLTIRVRQSVPPPSFQGMIGIPPAAGTGWQVPS